MIKNRIGVLLSLYEASSLHISMLSPQATIHKQKKIVLLFVVMFLAGTGFIKAQDNTEQQKKAAEWVAALQLTDVAKKEKVQSAIAQHLTDVRDWHNSHPVTENPGGVNPATGNAFSNLDWEVIYCSQKPKTVRENLMNVLNTELSPEQVEMILDKYTVGKVAFTLKGYEAIVPDLTDKERTEILKNLKQAREQAIDYKSMKEISAIFEIYKTKCEQYLNSNGRSWRQLFKNYVDKRNAEKAAQNKK